MSSIGSVTFITASFGPNPLGELGEIITRRGVDGLAIRKSGKRAEPVTVSAAKDVDGAAAVKTAIEAVKALQTTLQTVTDDLGNTWSNVLVVRANCVRQQKTGVSSGGLCAGDHLVRFSITLQFTE